MENKSRRTFIKNSMLATGATMMIDPTTLLASEPKGNRSKRVRIKNVNSNFEREPLIRPFGFKGGFMSEIWQTMNFLESDSGCRKVGLCTQSVLWSDADVFAKYSESGGNAMMYAMTEYALRMLKDYTFENPVEMVDDIWKEVLEYGKKITGNPNLRETFALNALVGIDNAAWMLYAHENNFKTFDEMIPEKWRKAVSHRSRTVASIPLMAYSIPVSEIKQAADEGYFFMKIKIGQPGTQEEMLEKDKARLTEIHKAIGHYRTSHSANGKLPYYFDANGRYEKKDTLMRLIDHARKIGAFDQIAVVEEPFPEEMKIDVSDIPLRLASDESAHTDADAIERIQMGYKAIAVKAIAKTLSMTLKIADAAKQRNVPCFCADLTVNPILIDWNKNVAARLDPFPGLGSGLLETNGHQNYRNWKQMESYHPYEDASWRKTVKGVFQLNSDFYQKSGGVLTDSPHYMKMFDFAKV
jgi:L-alanine-DL-glutamate epimerase-like enolase superfamily enzyme